LVVTIYRFAAGAISEHQCVFARNPHDCRAPGGGEPRTCHPLAEGRGTIQPVTLVDLDVSR